MYSATKVAVVHGSCQVSAGDADRYYNFPKGRENKAFTQLGPDGGALRSIAHKGELAESPWLKPDDIFGQELGEYGEHEVSLDPVSLYFNSQLGKGNIRSTAHT